MKNIILAAAQLLVVVVTLYSSASSASLMHVQASGSGWCTYLYALERDDCNNTDTAVLMNTFTGSFSTPNQLPLEVYRSWFAFELPAWSSVTGASISIWNDAANSNDDHPNALFNLYSALEISLHGLINGPSIGTMLAMAADGPSRYIEIQLNNDGIAALSSLLGSQIILAGNNDDGGKLFGSTTGTPAPFLTLKNSDLPATSTLALTVLALFALGLRRKAGAQSLAGAN